MTGTHYLPQFIVDSSFVNEFEMLLDRHHSNCLFDYVYYLYNYYNYICNF